MQGFTMTREMIPMLREGTKQAYSNRQITGKEEYIGDDGLRCLVYSAKTDNRPVVFNFHGGGFVFGCAEMDEFICRGICNALDVTVINAEYTLAPEGAFPISLEECYRLIVYVLRCSKEYRIDPNRVAVMGHSAGGLLSAVLSRMAAERGDFSLSAAILDYPPTDCKTPSSQKKRAKNTTEADYDFFSSLYCKEQEAENPYCSPVFAKKEDLRGLCPTLVLLAEKDLLRAEGEEYAKLLESAGVEVTLSCMPNAEHGFTLEDGKDTQTAIVLMCEFLKRHLFK